jgi:hypothetical protein
VFTARYALNPYIKQTRFVFKGLILQSITLNNKCTQSVINCYMFRCQDFILRKSQIQRYARTNTLSLYLFYHFNIFKRLSIWYCTSESDVLVLAILCILDCLRMALWCWNMYEFFKPEVPFVNGVCIFCWIWLTYFIYKKLLVTGVGKNFIPLWTESCPKGGAAGLQYPPPPDQQTRN